MTASHLFDTQKNRHSLVLIAIYFDRFHLAFYPGVADVQHCLGLASMWTSICMFTELKLCKK